MGAISIIAPRIISSGFETHTAQLRWCYYVEVVNLNAGKV